MKRCSDLLNNTKHTLSLLKQDSASHTTSTAMGPIQADHCRSVPTLQVLLLTTATAEQCSRLALTAAANLTWLEILYLDRGATPFYPQGGGTYWTTLSHVTLVHSSPVCGMLLENPAMGLSLSPTQHSAPAMLQKIKL